MRVQNEGTIFKVLVEQKLLQRLQYLWLRTAMYIATGGFKDGKEGVIIGIRRQRPLSHLCFILVWRWPQDNSPLIRGHSKPKRPFRKDQGNRYSVLFPLPASGLLLYAAQQPNFNQKLKAGNLQSDLQSGQVSPLGAQMPYLYLYYNW